MILEILQNRGEGAIRDFLATRLAGLAEKFIWSRNALHSPASERSN
jgi:hypothetical protein